MKHLDLSHRSIYTSLASAMLISLSTGCGEEPKPNLPSFVEGSLELLCEIESGESYLSELSFTVEDLDGSESLLTPSVELRSLSLMVEGEPLEVSEEESKCSVESCRTRYTWRFEASSQGRVSCGESGEELTATVTVSDENGHVVVEQLTSHLK